MALIISEGDGSANRAEVQQLVTWCSEQNLVLILRRKKKSSWKLSTLQLQFSKLSTTTESILVDCVTVWYTGGSAADTKDYPEGNKHSTKTTGTGDTPPKSFKKTLRIVPTLDACCVTCCPVVDMTGLSRQGQFFIQVQSLLKITFITVHHCTFYLISDWIFIVIYYIPLEKACLTALYDFVLLCEWYFFI